jgi:inorganic pyrophosphatase
MTDRTVDVVVEIPKGSRNKYEFDHERHVIRLDRRLFSATTYPGDYGFIPDTLGEDGDPLDALILIEDPTFPGCWVRTRILGVFWMQDEKGRDAKVICVPEDDPMRQGFRDIQDVPESLLSEIEHFFDVYKMLEPGKQSETFGFEGSEIALEEIRRGRERAAAIEG